MKIMITGVAGFIGTNAALHFIKKGDKILGLDDLSRSGSERNLEILKQYGPDQFEFIKTSLGNNSAPIPKNWDCDAIIHLAAQVGVQKSLVDPYYDLVSNIVGTFQVLEHARQLWENPNQVKRPFVIFASTNKVYGDIQVNKPVSESQPLNFHTPYGVSKGAADQYVLDYSRVFGVPGVVFRQSCIYGPYQHGAEEQGWVAWFLIANQTGQPLTIYGDGNQVRDCLYIDDLIELYDYAISRQDQFSGSAFNVGGGPQNTLSLNELVTKMNITTPIKFADWRKADQKYYVSDINKLWQLGWYPQTSINDGLVKLQQYVEKTWPK